MVARKLKKSANRPSGCSRVGDGPLQNATRCVPIEPAEQRRSGFDPGQSHVFLEWAAGGWPTVRGPIVTTRNYEAMFLLDSGRYAQDPEGVEGEVKSILEKVGADLLVATPFQDGKLAYEIEGRRKGLHYLTFFKLDGAQVDELHRQCRLSELVLRLLVIQQDSRIFDATVEAYQGHQVEVNAEAEAETADA